MHSHETYLNRLIRQGFKVAVCEQTEDPAEAKKRGAKSVVRREVERVVTPGTLTEDVLLDARRNNYLTAAAEAGGSLGLAWIDMSTGELLTQPLGSTLDTGGLDAALARIAPGELLVSDVLLQNQTLFETFSDWKESLSPLPASRFDSANGEKRLHALYGVRTLDAYGDFSRAEAQAHQHARVGVRAVEQQEHADTQHRRDGQHEVLAIEQPESAAGVADVGDAEVAVGRPRCSQGERLDDHGLGGLVEREQRDRNQHDETVALQQGNHRPVSVAAGFTRPSLWRIPMLR